MNIGIIGCGFIGTTIAQTANDFNAIERIYLFDAQPTRAETLAETVPKATVLINQDKLMDKVELVIEAASQEAVVEYGPKVLSAGVGLMVLSVGALAEGELLHMMQELAKQNKVNIYIPSGAIAGLDGVRSASMAGIEEVSLTTIKPVAGLKGADFLEEEGIDLTDISSPVTVFEGTAEEAVKKFPKNINVAATLGLCGVGLASTKVKIVADPSASRNKHKICVKGRFGKLSVEVLNQPSISNPKTSYLAALSAVACLKKIVDRVWIGT